MCVDASTGTIWVLTLHSKSETSAWGNHLRTRKRGSFRYVSSRHRPRCVDEFRIFVCAPSSNPTPIPGLTADLQSAGQDSLFFSGYVHISIVVDATEAVGVIAEVRFDCKQSVVKKVVNGRSRLRIVGCHWGRLLNFGWNSFCVIDQSAPNVSNGLK